MKGPSSSSSRARASVPSSSAVFPTATPASHLKDALLEIGSEELPASFISLGMRQLKTLAQTSLAERRMAFESVQVFGTPRRLAVLIQRMAERSEDQEKRLFGPPEAIARDANGAWSAAALGFARKNDLKPADLGIENGKVSGIQRIKGFPARTLLAELFPSWIRALQFPKSMVWEPSHFRYPRPLRWLTALYGSDVVSFSLAGVKAGRVTVGLYLHSAKKISLGSASKYVTTLQNQCVLVDPEERQQCIRRLAEQAAKRHHGVALLSPGLLEQVANLVEHPAAVLGSFDPAYLALPPAVLITCLEHHQRYFPVQDEKGGLTAHFIGMRNGMSVHQDVVRDGYERVLSARLADAQFFFDQDRRTPLAAKVEALKGVLFQQKLGSVFDKKERVRHLLDNWAGSFQLSETEREHALRTADLGKADLVTGMVGEFPELQGVMARIYAQHDGEPSPVAAACEEHYWPITLKGHLPTSRIGALVALADKLDTLAGDFAVGLIPSGSADPYGLRRAAVGVLRILEQTPTTRTLEDLIHEAVLIQQPGVVSAPAEVESKLRAFFAQRWSPLLEERGFRPDEIDAVLAGGLGCLPDTLARLEALHAVRPTPEFEPLAAAFKRATNIVRQAQKSGVMPPDDSTVDSARLVEAAEQALHGRLQEVGAQLQAAMQERRFAQALAAIAPLRAPLDSFFGDVMVMADDPALRANRLALVRSLVSLFSPIADFSRLQNA